MKNLLPALWFSFLTIGCASSPDYDRPADRRPAAARSQGEDRMREGGDGLGSMLPAGSWWFDTRYSERLGLSADQKSRLDALANDQMPAIDQAKREVAAAQADLRAQLNRDGVTMADLEPVHVRVREARAHFTDHQLRFISDVRMILTHDQWWTLQSEMQSMRSDSRPQERRGGRGNYPGGRRGGRGGYPGGGGGGSFG